MSDTKTILQEAAKLWWRTLVIGEQANFMDKYGYNPSKLLTGEDISTIYNFEHPTTPVQEFEKDIQQKKEKDFSTVGEWKYKADSKNMRFIIHSEEREIAYIPQCMDGEWGKYETSANIDLIVSTKKTKERNQVLVESIERMSEEYVKLKAHVKLLTEALEDMHKVSELYLINTETHPDFKMNKDSTITHYFKTAVRKAKSALEQTK